MHSDGHSRYCDATFVDFFSILGISFHLQIPIIFVKEIRNVYNIIYNFFIDSKIKSFYLFVYSPVIHFNDPCYMTV